MAALTRGGGSMTAHITNGKRPRQPDPLRRSGRCLLAVQAVTGGLSDAPRRSAGAKQDKGCITQRSDMMHGRRRRRVLLMQRFGYR